MNDCLGWRTKTTQCIWFFSLLNSLNVGLFVPLHFRSRQRKVHRWHFRSRGTFVPWNIRSLELSLLWNFRSSGANVPRTFAPWNFRSFRTNRLFQELSLQVPKNNLSCSYTSRSSLRRTCINHHRSLNFSNWSAGNAVHAGAKASNTGN